MMEEALVGALQRLRRQQTNDAEENIGPRALGLLHARAAVDIAFARRLVFDGFELVGVGPRRQDSHEKIMEGVAMCLSVFVDELSDPPSDEDWKEIEALARV